MSALINVGFELRIVQNPQEPTRTISICEELPDAVALTYEDVPLSDDGKLKTILSSTRIRENHNLKNLTVAQQTKLLADYSSNLLPACLNMINHITSKFELTVPEIGLLVTVRLNQSAAALDGVSLPVNLRVHMESSESHVLLNNHNHPVKIRTWDFNPNLNTILILIQKLLCVRVLTVNTGKVNMITGPAIYASMLLFCIFNQGNKNEP